MKALLVACLALTGAALAPTASANECGGSLVDYSVLYAHAHNGQRIGEMATYYNASNGNFCAVLYHGGPSWGVQSWTRVQLNDCNGGTCPSTTVRDAGHYAYRAGPVRMYGRGRCNRATGSMRFNGVNYQAASSNHCR